MAKAEEAALVPQRQARASGARVQQRRERRDAWTKAEERAFLATLAECCNISEAARAIGKCRQGAYDRRKRRAAFARAWDEALEQGYCEIEMALMRAALFGSESEEIVLDGDGALLMNLQCLVTIAEAAPKNFLHFVSENGCYEANGSHPIPGQGKVDFAGMARSAGYAHVFEFGGMNQFTSELPGIMALEGPVFVPLKIEPAGELEYDYPYTHGAQAREDFKQAIAPMIAKRDAT